MKTSWAILLIKFSDNDAEPYSRSRYQEIFTTLGSGKWNMVDYFRDMSHGKLDLSGSEVFGWYTLDKKESEYVGNGGNNQGRQDLINWARQKAIDEGVPLDKFYNVVIVLNKGLDLFGGVNGVVCGDDGKNRVISGLSPSLLGQEMGHAYGLNHSRRIGTTEDYQDPFDIMSTMAAHTTDHPVYVERHVHDGSQIFRIGPGLNAANMSAMGWLNEDRVYNVTNGNHSKTLKLRPLHRTDLPGYLAIKFGEYFIEFRMNEWWDSAFGPAVLVHTYEGGNSYIVSENGGSMTFITGSTLSTPEELSIYGSGISIHVRNIDASNRIATVELISRSAQIPREWPIQGPYDTPWIKWKELLLGGEAYLVINKQVIEIRKQSPLFDILEQVSIYESSKNMKSQQTKAVIQEEALIQIDNQMNLLKSGRFKSPLIQNIQDQIQENSKL